IHLLSSTQPVELLYKPLIEFQDELVPQGFSLRTIYEIYDAQEHERLNHVMNNAGNHPYTSGAERYDSWWQSVIWPRYMRYPSDMSNNGIQIQYLWVYTRRAKEIYEQAEKLRRKNLMKARPKRRPRSAPGRRRNAFGTPKRPVSAHGTNR
ncbi:hypothetical protein LSH36_577g03012, partial [Paralvinella palmiformis]